MTSIDQFAEEAAKLYASAPAHTRYSLKYRHCDGKLQLKVTNDIVTLTYATDQAAELKRVEKLNALLFAKMSGTEPLEPSAMQSAEETPKTRSGKSKKR